MSTREDRQRRIDAAVLRTITSADWAAMFRARDWLRNGVRSQVGEKILTSGLGKSQPGCIEKSN